MEPSDLGFIDRLISHGHLIPSGVSGVFGRGGTCESIHVGLGSLISRLATEDEPESLRFPPVVPRSLLDQVGYERSFPHLCAGIVDAERSDTELAMLPVACYPAYPAIAARGPVPVDGVTLDLGPALVFRREVSTDPARLQAFHQRELVRIGGERSVLDWRDRWLERATRIMTDLGLTAEFTPAADPFFGRRGRLLAQNQLDLHLKYEAVVPITAPTGTAVASFNYHRDEFAKIFGLTDLRGETSHTACVGFGIERLALALFAQQGFDVNDWPVSIRHTLGIE